MMKIMIAAGLSLMDIIRAKLPNFGAFFVTCVPTIFYAFAIVIRLGLNLGGIKTSFFLALIGIVILAIFSWYTWRNDGAHGWPNVRRWMREKQPNRWLLGSFSLVYFLFSILLFYLSLDYKN